MTEAERDELSHRGAADLKELGEPPLVQQGGSIRRTYLIALDVSTGRPVIIYYSDFLSGGDPAST